MPIGMLMAFVLMNVANIMEGGDPMSLFNIPAIVLVFGGTLMATAASFTPGEIMKMPVLAIKGFKSPPKLDDAIKQITELAEVARKDGALALEVEDERRQGPVPQARDHPARRRGRRAPHP